MIQFFVQNTLLKKELAGLLICILFFNIIALTFLFPPKKAQAFGVWDVLSVVWSALDLAYSAGKAAYDAAAWALDKLAALDQKLNGLLKAALFTLILVLLNRLTNDIVAWINGGGKGSPKFVQNWKTYLTQAGDAATGRIIEGLGASWVCEEFKPQLTLALQEVQKFQDYKMPKCTLKKAIANINEFYDDFTQGGWGNWLTLTQNPQYDFSGSYFLAYDQMQAEKTKSIESAQNEAISGGGFLAGKRVCSACSMYKTPPVDEQERLYQASGGTYNAETPVEKWYSQKDCADLEARVQGLKLKEADTPEDLQTLYDFECDKKDIQTPATIVQAEAQLLVDSGRKLISDQFTALSTNLCPPSTTGQPNTSAFCRIGRTVGPFLQAIANATLNLAINKGLAAIQKSAEEQKMDGTIKTPAINAQGEVMTPLALDVKTVTTLLNRTLPMIQKTISKNALPAIIKNRNILTNNDKSLGGKGTGGIREHQHEILDGAFEIYKIMDSFNLCPTTCYLPIWLKPTFGNIATTPMSGTTTIETTQKITIKADNLNWPYSVGPLGNIVFKKTVRTNNSPLGVTPIMTSFDIIQETLAADTEIKELDVTSSILHTLNSAFVDEDGNDKTELPPPPPEDGYIYPETAAEYTSQKLYNPVVAAENYLDTLKHYQTLSEEGIIKEGTTTPNIIGTQLDPNEQKIVQNAEEQLKYALNLFLGLTKNDKQDDLGELIDLIGQKNGQLTETINNLNSSRGTKKDRLDPDSIDGDVASLWARFVELHSNMAGDPTGDGGANAGTIYSILRKCENPSEVCLNISPDNISDMSAQVMLGRIHLSWTNPSARWSGTKIVRKTGSYPIKSTDGIEIYDGGASTFNNTDVTVGTTYYYAAFAHDNAGHYSDGTVPGARTSATAQ